MNTSLLETYMNQLNEMEDNPNDKFKIAHTIAVNAANDLSYTFNSSDAQSFESTLSQYFHAFSESKQFIKNDQNNMSYEIGRIAGLCEAYSEMYQTRKKNQVLEEELKKRFSTIRDASKKILNTLCIFAQKNEWITHSSLANECDQTPNALSNNLKRLISIGAVDAIREGRNVLYHLSSSCEQYLSRAPELLSTTEAVSIQGIPLTRSSFFQKPVQPTKSVSYQDMRFSRKAYISHSVPSRKKPAQVSAQRQQKRLAAFSSKLIASSPFKNITFSPDLNADPLDYSQFTKENLVFENRR